MNSCGGLYTPPGYFLQLLSHVACSVNFFGKPSRLFNFRLVIMNLKTFEVLFEGRNQNVIIALHLDGSLLSVLFIRVKDLKGCKETDS